jgi:hypothetical protein
MMLVGLVQVMLFLSERLEHDTVFHCTGLAIGGDSGHDGWVLM